LDPSKSQTNREEMKKDLALLKIKVKTKFLELDIYREF